jgi:response regulator NasT
MTEKVRILVAEDESLIRLDIVETLKEAGYDVVADAGDGEEALALATEYEPELAVLDVKMPKLDGISVAQKLQEMSIPVVMLTSFSSHGVCCEAIQLQRFTPSHSDCFISRPRTDGFGSGDS